MQQFVGLLEVDHRLDGFLPVVADEQQRLHAPLFADANVGIRRLLVELDNAQPPGRGPAAALAGRGAASAAQGSKQRSGPRRRPSPEHL